MEEYFSIPTSDWFEISGILNYHWTQKQQLIVLAHGLTWSMTEAHYYAAKEFFTQQWYTVARFNFYGGGDKNRKLHTTCIADHSKDIETVLDFFSAIYKDIYLAWHSLAWPSIVWMKKIPPNLRKIIYWDPAFDTSGTILRCIEKNGEYYFDPRNGKLIEISSHMLKEIQENTHMKSLADLDFSPQKSFIVFAGNHGNASLSPQTDTLGIKSIVIEGANHGFTQEWKYQELFEATLEFIKS